MNVTSLLSAAKCCGALALLIPSLAWACTPQGEGPTLLSPSPNETGVPTNVLIIIGEVRSGFVPTLEWVTDGGAVSVPLTEVWRRGATVAMQPNAALPHEATVRLPGVFGAPPASFDASFTLGVAADVTPPLPPEMPRGEPYSDPFCWGDRVSFTLRQPAPDAVTYELADDAGVIVPAVNHIEVACSTAGVSLVRRSRGDVVLLPDAGSLSVVAIDRAGNRSPAVAFSVADSCAVFGPDAGSPGASADAGSDSGSSDAGADEPKRMPAGGCSATGAGLHLAWILLIARRRPRPRAGW